MHRCTRFIRKKLVKLASLSSDFSFSPSAPFCLDSTCLDSANWEASSISPEGLLALAYFDSAYRSTVWKENWSVDQSICRNSCFWRSIYVSENGTCYESFQPSIKPGRILQVYRMIEAEIHKPKKRLWQFIMKLRILVKC